MKNRLSKLWNEKWLLLLCFILGFLSWQGIRKNTGFEVSVSNIAVDVDVPDGWAVLEKSVDKVTILFRGSREDIRYLNSGQQLRIVVPVSNPTANEGLHIKLSEKFLQNPTSSKVVRFSPTEIFVKLDRESERLLPVKATISGSLPDGIEVDKIVCTPASVRVSGAEQVLDKMLNIHTEAVKLDNRQISFKENVQIALPQNGRIQTDPAWVSVDFSLVQHTSTQEFDNIPVRALLASGDTRTMQLTPQTINIKVTGQKHRIEQMRTADIFAYVNCADLLESTSYDLPVALHLPSGLKLVKATPAVIHVEIEN
jgi:hypothetical protein